MDLKIQLLLLCASVCLAVGARTFSGDQVIEIVPQDEQQLKLLQEMEMREGVDFWRHPWRVGTPVDLHVTLAQLPTVKGMFEKYGMQFKVKVENLQKLVDNERSPSLFNSGDILLRYASQPEIASWLEQTAASCGSRCTLMPLGTSLEGREMKAIKITAAAGAGNKPAVFVDGGIHAREWISPVFVNNMISKLINDYDSDVEVKAMLDTYDWYILPLLNPDGYQYSHDSDRLWRKNRAVTSKRRCRGVDLNRNFGYEWGGLGVSKNPCSEIYCGPDEFSEPESQALRDFLLEIPNLNIYLSFHSYGQYFLYPWGYDGIRAPNDAQLDAAGDEAARAIQTMNGEQWIVGNAALALYPAAGASDDWAYGGAGAEFAYCVELPPNDDSIGFVLPEADIPEVVSSVWPGIKALVSKITSLQQHQAVMFDGERLGKLEQQKKLLESLMAMK